MNLAKIYEGLNVDISVLNSTPKDDEDYLQHYLPSKLWRLNNLYTIVDKIGIKRTFVMNEMQHKIYAALLRHPRVILLKSRQIGGSTFASLNNFDDALFIDNISIGLMAQGQAESATLLERVKLAWAEFPQVVKDLLGVILIKDNRSEFSFSNGSTLFIRTSFRSATLHRLWISEFAKISVKYPERALETVTGTLQAIKPGNPILIESTAERGGQYQRMWDEAVNLGTHLDTGAYSANDFYPLFIGWTDDATCAADTPQVISEDMAEYFEKIELELQIKLSDTQKWFYIIKTRELGEKITQEYPTTAEEAFSSSRDGSYYAKDFRKYVVSRGRVRKGLYDPLYPANVVMDLGMNDAFTLVWFQVKPLGMGYVGYIIDEYENSGEGLEHYASIMHKKPYAIEVVYLPHDAKKRDLTSNLTIQGRFRELGVGRTRILPRKNILEGIEQVRKMLPNLYVDEKCVKVIDTFYNYTKEWDEINGVWLDRPKHNKYSHFADTIRYMAMSNVRLKSNVVTTATATTAASDFKRDYADNDGFAL